MSFTEEEANEKKAAGCPRNSPEFREAQRRKFERHPTAVPPPNLPRMASSSAKMSECASCGVQQQEQGQQERGVLSLESPGACSGGRRIEYHCVVVDLAKEEQGGKIIRKKSRVGKCGSDHGCNRSNICLRLYKANKRNNGNGGEHSGKRPFRLIRHVKSIERTTAADAPFGFMVKQFGVPGCVHLVANTEESLEAWVDHFRTFGQVFKAHQGSSGRVVVVQDDLLCLGRKNSAGDDRKISFGEGFDNKENGPRNIGSENKRPNYRSKCSHCKWKANTGDKSCRNCGKSLKVVVRNNSFWNRRSVSVLDMSLGHPRKSSAEKIAHAITRGRSRFMSRDNTSDVPKHAVK